MTGAGARRRPRPERGASAVEFALVVVPLLYLVFGVISYGYLLSFRQAVGQAAAEGARAAAVAPGGLDDADVRLRAIDAVNDALSGFDVTCSAAGVLTRGDDPAGTCAVSAPQTCTSASTTATCVEVSIDYDYDGSPLLPDVGFGYVMPDTVSYSTEAQVS